MGESQRAMRIIKFKYTQTEKNTLGGRKRSRETESEKERTQEEKKECQGTEGGPEKRDMSSGVLREEERAGAEKRESGRKSSSIGGTLTLGYNWGVKAVGIET